MFGVVDERGRGNRPWQQDDLVFAKREKHAIAIAKREKCAIAIAKRKKHAFD